MESKKTPARVARIQRRPDGSVEIFLESQKPFALPQDLGELFIALASRDAVARGNSGSPGFKSSQGLVHELGSRLNKMVTRRDLRRLIGRLRRALSRDVTGGHLLIESRRGTGWRISLLRLHGIR